MSRTRTCDVLIIGGGIIGLTVARELLHRGIKRITILEKEESLGRHASGHNSGVLHAGIYYSSDSLKARFCAKSAQQIKAFAAERALPVSATGKVLCATEESHLPALEALYNRSLANGIRVEKIDCAQLKSIEPMARTVSWALYSPDTAVINPVQVLLAIAQDIQDSGAVLEMASPARTLSPTHRTVETDKGVWSYGHLINAAGLHADRFAHQYGVGEQFRILPFKGCYRKLTAQAAQKFKTLIYPVPDSRLPFLGVHLTKSVSGDVWVGPTADPAFGRENYAGMQGITWNELPVLMADLLRMTLKNASGLGRHMREELEKKLPGGLLKAVRALAPDLQANDFSAETKIGMRAQLIHAENAQLVMDFVVESGRDSTHVLNAVSPGFTASFAFAEYIADQMMKGYRITGATPAL